MAKILRAVLPLMLLCTLPATAQGWSIGAGTGPFAFGKFAVRTLRPSTEQTGTAVSQVKLSASVRPGAVFDVQYDFNNRLALRLQATFTESPLAIKPESGGGVALNAGHIDVTTLTLPLLININPHGRLRFHIEGGPAYAIYHIKREFTSGVVSPFQGTRGRWGGAAGAGVMWWWSNRFGVEGEVLDIVTSSPLRKSDFVGSASISIPKPQNEHVTIGIRWRI